MSLIKVLMEQKPSETPKRIPEWQRTAFINESDDRVFLPSAIASMSDQTALLLCCIDGVSYVLDNNHVYVDSDWIKREYPNHLEALEALCAKFRNPTMVATTGGL